MTSKKWLKSPYLWAFLIGIATLHIIKQCALANRRAPEPLVIVPDWALTDQHGQPLSKNDLLGKIYIADFFFTSCPSVCPKLTEAMKEIYARFTKYSDQVHFVSITVDPEVDTPAVLKKYMVDNGIDHANWHSLTGTPADIYDVVVNKMKVHMGEKQPINDSDIYDVPHLFALALFDQKGNLRGLFKTDSMEMSSLVRGAQFLLEKPTNTESN